MVYERGECEGALSFISGEGDCVASGISARFAPLVFGDTANITISLHGQPPPKTTPNRVMWGGGCTLRTLENGEKMQRPAGVVARCQRVGVVAGCVAGCRGAGA